MDSSLSDLVHDYQLTTRYEGAYTIHYHRDPDAPPSAPHRQERWKKVRTLGHGGQGDVILQTCTDGGRNFSNRAYFAKSLGWYATSNKLYIAMEFFPDGDLYAYIRDHRRLTDDECSHIISQLLSGVAVMHEAGFAHRDVKPQDLAPSSWWVKLADFGISKKLGAETTGTTLAPGTPLYMAPELLQYDSRSILTENYFKADIWAIGITAFFILTKSVPFRSQLAILHYTGNLEDLATILVNFQVTENAQNFIAEILKAQPCERPDAERVKQHTWIRHWLPEIPLLGAFSR
ncbi:hypothetical protein LB503_010636 [Fusarium chuoi]|nr:hypothetical protein LB503_010636 [Fusarium chuoi]